jgi:predicted DNA-binding transcriptional regulator YafY
MSSGSSPTARALLTLELIQNRPGITGEALAEQLGVTDRAARRYVGILREAGIPVESVSGRYGGYRLGRGQRPAPLTFTAPEALGLVMAVLQGWHGAAVGDHPVAAALGKIVRVLPSASAAPVEALRRVSARNPADAAASPDPRLAAAVAQHCAAGGRLRVRYRAGRTEREMLVDPWAVVVRHGRWYLLCFSHRARARRVLRLDRIAAVEPTGEVATVPVGLDPAVEVEQHLAEGWTHRAEVRFAAPLERARGRVPSALGRLSPLAGPEPACLLRGSTEDPDWYAGQLAGCELPFTVLGSAEIAAAVAALSRRLAAAVSSAASPAPAAPRPDPARRG